MAEPAYIALVASLPHLEPFESAEQLPLTRKQLDQRLAMLRPDDALQLRLAESLIRWQRQPITRTTPQMLDGYRMVMARATRPALRELVDLRMNQRTALVALRRRRRGLGPPAEGEIWGVGSWTRGIRARWDQADLGVAARLPWIDQARKLLEDGNAVELERLMMDAVWRWLSRLRDARPFGFDAVMAFVFQWDILQRWLAYDASAASERFRQLITEVTREHQQLFA